MNVGLSLPRFRVSDRKNPSPRRIEIKRVNDSRTGTLGPCLRGRPGSTLAQWPRRRLRIDPLATAVTAEYLVMRLARVGCGRDIFASDAVAMVHETATGGIRDVDRLATAVIRAAATQKRRLVERDAVARVIEAHTHGDTAAAMAIT